MSVCIYILVYSLYFLALICVCGHGACAVIGSVCSRSVWQYEAHQISQYTRYWWRCSRVFLIAAVYCSLFCCVAVSEAVALLVLWQCVAVCGIVSQCVAVCRSVVQSIAVCCSVLQSAKQSRRPCCCSVLQCVAVYCIQRSSRAGLFPQKSR